MTAIQPRHAVGEMTINEQSAIPAPRCSRCGSHDTVAAPRADGIEELECNACGTITNLQIVPSAP
jgi:Zn ribbon nucleic-acid-binding protein